MKETIAEKIAAYRRENKLSQAALARQLNVSQPTVHYYEIGRTRPNPHVLRVLADIGVIDTAPVQNTEQDAQES